MNRNVIETVMGAVVLIIAIGFLVSAYKGREDATIQKGYIVSAKFSNATGIAVGSDVRLGGVKIGVVDSLKLDTETYQATVAMLIKEGVPLPLDSTAAIIGDGLLGSKFVALEPGADEASLKNGEIIEFTQSSVSIEELIGKFVFSNGGIDGEDNNSDTTSETDSSAVPSLFDDLSIEEEELEEEIVSENEEHNNTETLSSETPEEAAEEIPEAKSETKENPEQIIEKLEEKTTEALSNVETSLETPSVSNTNKE